MPRIPLHELSAKHQAEASAQLHKLSVVTPPSAASAPKKKRLRQNSTGPNKTEQEFETYLRSFPQDMVAATLLQSVTLKLANGVRYTPDFIVVRDEPLDDAAGFAQTVEAYEVKGFMRDDAAVKIKVAASVYPWIKFHLVTKLRGKDKAWQIDPILS